MEIEAGDFDVVIVMHFKTHWIFPFLRKPAVLYLLEPPRSFHESWIYVKKPLYMRPLIKLHGWIDRFIIQKWCHHIVGNSAHTMEVCYRAYGKFGHYVYPGVDDTKFFPPGGAVERRHVLVVGDTGIVKQPVMAVGALACIEEAHRPPLMVVGPFNQEVQDVAEVLGVDVDWIEGASTDDLRNYYQTAICTVCASVMEPYGLTAAESLACGTPVVCVDEGGFRETVTPCSGMRVPRNMSKIAEGIVRFMAVPIEGGATLPDAHYLKPCMEKFEAVLRGIISSEE